MSRSKRMIEMSKTKEQTESEKICLFWEAKKTSNWFCNRAPPRIIDNSLDATIHDKKDKYSFSPSTEKDPFHISRNNDPTYSPSESRSEINLENLPGSQKVKEWLNNSDFESPDGDNLAISNNGKVYTELQPLEFENILPLCEERCSNSEDNQDPVSEQIIIQNIKIRSPDVVCKPPSFLKNEIALSTIISDTTDDNLRDKDFDVNEFSSQTSSEESNISPGNEECNIYIDGASDAKKALLRNRLPEQIKEKQTNAKKVVRCMFCEEDIISKNFMRHLERHHASEKQVIDVLKIPKNSRDRRQALALLRHDTNFELFITGNSRPYRKPSQQILNYTEYYPCPYCKIILRKGYLKRHTKFCIHKKSHSNKSSNRKDHLSHSQTVVACAVDITNTVSKLNVKKLVFDMMRGDDVAFVAKKDLLIAHFGDSYLKKHKKESILYACSNRMREMSRLLINYRNLTNKADVPFKELIHPKNFENVISAARNLVGFDPIKKTFKSPSLAMHLGTSLKFACDELTHLILKESKGFKCGTPFEKKEYLQNVKNFKKLVESRWTIELASLAHKDLHEKRWSKPLLLPLVNDIKLFRDGILKIASDCEKKLLEQDDEKTYKLLVNVALALVIVFNRRRIGDVQYLKIADYKNDQRSNSVDFENALTETEKMLTKRYKRVMNSGKGSRAVVILIPETIGKYIDLLLEKRHKYIPTDNEYVFAIPGSKIKWGKGDVAIRTLTNKMNLKHPQALTSNKLRKHIATVMQLISMSKDDEKQFSRFMGHTEKTHQEFYELPVDVYQTAKVSKILLMMEKGNIPTEHKGKSLSDINFDENLEYAIEDDNDDNGEITLMDNNVHHDDVSTQNSSPIVDKRKSNTCTITKTGPKAKKSCTTPPTVNLNEDNHYSHVESHERKQKPAKKRGWSAQDIMKLETAFKSYIKRGIYPPRKEIQTFLGKTKINRTVVVVKAKLQHLMKQK